MNSMLRIFLIFSILAATLIPPSPGSAQVSLQMPRPDFDFAERERSKEVLLAIKLKSGFVFQMTGKNSVQLGEKILTPVTASSDRMLVFTLPARQECVTQFEVCNDVKTNCETQRWNLEFPPETQKAKATRALPKP